MSRKLATDFFYYQSIFYLVLNFFHFFFGKIKVFYRTLHFMGNMNARAGYMKNSLNHSLMMK